MCPISSETSYDVIPMMVIGGLFLLLGWSLRLWKKRKKKNS